jgi:hypothetical protein
MPAIVPSKCHHSGDFKLELISCTCGKAPQHTILLLQHMLHMQQPKQALLPLPRAATAVQAAE